MTDRMRAAFEAEYKYGIGSPEQHKQDRENALYYFQAGYQARDAEVAELVGALEEIEDINLSGPFDCYKSMIDESNARAAVEIAQAALAKHKQEDV